MKPLILIASCLALTWMLPAAASADLWEYRTEEGVVSFTDSLDSVPAKYRDSAVRRGTHSLLDYERTTIVQAGATTAPTTTWAALDDSSWGDDGSEVMDVESPLPLAEMTPVLLDVGGGVTVPIPGGAGADLVRVQSSLYDNDGFIEESSRPGGPTRRVYRGDDIIATIR